MPRTVPLEGVFSIVGMFTRYFEGGMYVRRKQKEAVNGYSVSHGVDERRNRALIEVARSSGEAEKWRVSKLFSWWTGGF